MGTYTASVRWERGEALFVDSSFSRSYLMRFDGGVEVVGSSSPLMLPPPMSEVAAVDPEEAFVASISGCHMLFFLLIAAGRRFCVDTYQDEAFGILARGRKGRMMMTNVTLRPQATFSGHKRPSPEDIRSMHENAHARCFLANSVLTEVLCEPLY